MAIGGLQVVALALIRFLDRVQDDPEAQGALSDLIGYLVDPGSSADAFAATLQAGADLLFVMEDEENIIPIGRALAHRRQRHGRQQVGIGAADRQRRAADRLVQRPEVDVLAGFAQRRGVPSSSCAGW